MITNLIKKIISCHFANFRENSCLQRWLQCNVKQKTTLLRNYQNRLFFQMKLLKILKNMKILEFLYRHHGHSGLISKKNSLNSTLPLAFALLFLFSTFLTKQICFLNHFLFPEKT